MTDFDFAGRQEVLDAHRREAALASSQKLDSQSRIARDLASNFLRFSEDQGVRGTSVQDVARFRHGEREVFIYVEGEDEFRAQSSDGELNLRGLTKSEIIDVLLNWLDPA